MPQESKSKFAPAAEQSLENLTADSSDPVALKKAVQLAVDYRGDVTITRASSAQPVECFIFDFKDADKPATAQIRVIVKGDDGRTAIALSDVASIQFTGKDTAAGRSFETWMKKYVAKKLAGEKASIESESLDG